MRQENRRPAFSYVNESWESDSQPFRQANFWAKIENRRENQRLPPESVGDLVNTKYLT